MFNGLPDGGFGGNILVASGSLTISDCVFNNAGTALRPNSNIVSWKPALFVIVCRCQFHGSITNTGQDGVGLNIQIFSGNLTVLDSIFTTDVIASDGGCISFIGVAMLIHNCTFSGISIARNGGYIFVSTAILLVQITDCTFGPTSVVNGGHIAMLSSSAIITGCTFIGGSAAVSGGSIYFVIQVF